MRTLYGKGVWAWQLAQVPRAIDMAVAIGARIVLFKTGQEGEYFEYAARRAVQRIYDAGLIPCAWPVISCRDPDAEAEVAIQTILDGYVGLVFDVEKPASGQHAGAARLGERMLETELPQDVMFFTSLPNISANLDLPYAEMSRFCKGGFMPQTYATFGWSPHYTLDVIAYREFRLWTRQQHIRRPLYPVLGLYRDEQGRYPLSLPEVGAWLDALARYKPTFFSVYRAGVVPEEMWPLLARLETTAQGEKPPPPPPLPGTYVTVQVGETISELCRRYDCTLGQFFAWNGHLWDARNKPREPELLEHGWIVRVE
jgi:LysM repeat protein